MTTCHMSKAWWIKLSGIFTGLEGAHKLTQRLLYSQKSRKRKQNVIFKKYKKEIIKKKRTF